MLIFQTVIIINNKKLTWLKEYIKQKVPEDEEDIFTRLLDFRGSKGSVSCLGVADWFSCAGDSASVGSEMVRCNGAPGLSILGRPFLFLNSAWCNITIVCKQTLEIENDTIKPLEYRNQGDCMQQSIWRFVFLFLTCSHCTTWALHSSRNRSGRCNVLLLHLNNNRQI